MILIIILLISSLFLFLAVFIILNLLLFISFRGAVYVPTSREKIKRMIEFANIKPGERAVDLGAGDGRLVIALAKAGAEAHGYEINPFLVFLAKRNIRKAGLSGKAFTHWKSFWREDFSKFDVITVYGESYIMRKLEEKLKKELKKSSRVISNCFTFPMWSPSKKADGVYLYENSVW
jgi:precorrin-6B methylase 2